MGAKEATHVSLVPESGWPLPRPLARHLETFGRANGGVGRPAPNEGVVARREVKVYLNETAPRWENHSYSASLRPPCFALASCQQSLAQTAPLARATNLCIKANLVPPAPRLRSRACTRKAPTACGEVIVCARPFGYRLLPFTTIRPSSTGEKLVLYKLVRAVVS